MLVRFSSPHERARHPRFADAFEQAAHEHPGVVFLHVDIAAQPELAAALGVTATPALLVYRDGVRVAVREGGQPKASLDRLLELHG